MVINFIFPRNFLRFGVLWRWMPGILGTGRKSKNPDVYPICWVLNWARFPHEREEKTTNMSPDD